jgi:hypothetical protein
MRYALELKSRIRFLCVDYPLGFLVSWAVVNLILVTYFSGVSYTNIIRFITAPLNFEEVIEPQYGSVNTGVVYNLFLVVLLILFAELCLVHYNQLGSKLTMDRAFWASFLASYITSPILFLLYRGAGSGTSIIGFCMSLVITVNLFISVVREVNELRRVGRVVMLAVLLFSIVYLEIDSYIINASYLGHIIGASVFALILLSSNKDGKAPLKIDGPTDRKLQEI